MTEAQFLRYINARLKTETYAAIGNDFGVSRQAVFRWIDGKAHPTPSQLRLAALLKSSTKAA